MTSQDNSGTETQARCDRAAYFRTIAFVLSILLGGTTHVVAQEYSHDVSTWQEILVPALEDSGEREVWDLASDYSMLAWRVYSDNGKPAATLVPQPSKNTVKEPPFDAHAGRFSSPTEYWKVDDGYLTAFNHGEFGAALYWFSSNGKQHYRMSYDHVQAFFVIGKDIYAIEGMNHMSLSCGSVIKIAKQGVPHRWKVERVAKLPWAPYAVVTKQDGTMLLALSNSLVEMGADHDVHVLIDEAPWESLYPSSAFLTSDERFLYLGMRQFVGEVDLQTRQLRMLVPNAGFLNKLPEDVEQRLRRDYAPKPGQSYDRSAKSQHLPGTLCDMTAADARKSHGRVSYFSGAK